jgi:hypothetical protein
VALLAGSIPATLSLHLWYWIGDYLLITKKVPPSDLDGAARQIAEYSPECIRYTSETKPSFSRLVYALWLNEELSITQMSSDEASTAVSALLEQMSHADAVDAAETISHEFEQIPSIIGKLGPGALLKGGTSPPLYRDMLFRVASEKHSRFSLPPICRHAWYSLDDAMRQLRRVRLSRCAILGSGKGRALGSARRENDRGMARIGSHCDLV